MKYFKSQLLALTMVFSFTALADLEDGAKVKMSYDEVSIYELKGASVKSKFYPGSRNSTAYYKATLTINLEVEGNICSNSPSTLGTHWKWTTAGEELSLHTGMKKLNRPMECAEYSKPTQVVVEEKFEVPKYDTEPVSQVYVVKLNDEDSTVKVITVSERGNKLVATIK